MSDLRRFEVDDEHLVRYLLGLLSDHERESMDEAGIVDDEVAARLRLADVDLVDAYVRGTLRGETLTQFETYYLSSPRRRENVRCAERFLSAMDRVAAPRAAAAVGQTRLRWPVAVAGEALAAAPRQARPSLLLGRVHSVR